MSLDADLIVDRRRMRRKLTFWRVAAVLVAVAAVVGAGLRVRGSRRHHRQRPGGSIARVTIEGLIRGNRQRVEALERLVEVERQGSDRSHQQPGRHRRRLRAASRLADAAQGARSRWWSWSTAWPRPAAISRRWPPITSSRSRARSSARSASSSSIPNFTDLLKTIGVKVESIKSSPLKAAPNGLSRPARRRAPRSRRSSWIPTTGSKPGARPAQPRSGARSTGRRRPRVHRPAGAGAEADRRAGRREGRGRLARPRRRASIPRPRCATTGSARGSATCRSCTPPWPVCSMRWVWARWRERSKDRGAFQAVERLNLDGLLALWHPPMTN